MHEAYEGLESGKNGKLEELRVQLQKQHEGSAQDKMAMERDFRALDVRYKAIIKVSCGHVLSVDFTSR